MRVKSLNYIELYELCNLIQEVDSDFTTETMLDILADNEAYWGEDVKGFMELSFILDFLENHYDNQPCSSCQGQAIENEECEECDGNTTQMHIYKQIIEKIYGINLGFMMDVKLS